MSSPSPSMGQHQHYLSLRRRVGLAVLACVQNAAVGGLIYGWANIDKTLLGFGPGGAGLSLVETTTIFSWASATSLASTLALGVVLDRMGPRVCSLSGQACILVGIFLFAVAKSFANFAVATCLVALGGPGIQLSIVHVANLFPQNQYLVLCGLNGCISLSVCVFAGFDWAFHNVPNTTVRVLFGSYLPVVLVSLIASAIFWPDQPFEPPATIEHDPFWEPTPEDVFVEATVAHQHLLEQPLDSGLRSKTNPRFQRSATFMMSDDAIHHGGDAALVSLKDQPFLKQLTSATYVRSVLLFVVTCFLANFYVASFSTEVADFQTYTPGEQHHLSQMLALTMSSGVAVSFFVGWLMDRIGQVVCIVLTIVLGQLQLIILVLFGNREHWMIASFGLYVLFRQFLFPVYIAGVTDRLGFKYFGLLSGVGFALSGFSQIYMASLVLAVQGDCHRMTTFDTTTPTRDCLSGYWKQLHRGEIALLAVLLLAPFFEHLDRTQRDVQLKKAMRRRSGFGYGSITEETEEDDDGGF